MQWARLYREQGLGALVREFWIRERIAPPPGLSTAQVWEWINRSDVAASVVLQLVPDPRFVLVAFCAMAREAVRFLGGVPLQTLQEAEIVAYGIDTSRLAAVALRLQDHQQDYLRGIAGRPEKETSWMSWSLSAVVSALNSASLIAGNAPEERIQIELHKIANCSWEALRHKFRDVDGMSHETAKRAANNVLVGVLRDQVRPSHFQATFQRSRAS